MMEIIIDDSLRKWLSRVCFDAGVILVCLATLATMESAIAQGEGQNATVDNNQAANSISKTSFHITAHHGIVALDTSTTEYNMQMPPFLDAKTPTTPQNA
jgi:hypothetical protein